MSSYKTGALAEPMPVIIVITNEHNMIIEITRFLLGIESLLDRSLYSFIEARGNYNILNPFCQHLLPFVYFLLFSKIPKANPKNTN